MDMKIAICQFDTRYRDVSGNLAHAEELVAACDAELAVLPEMFATGFVTDCTDAAESMEGQSVRWLTEAAAAYGRAIAGSLLIRDGDKIVNRLLFAEPSGTLSWYDKRHLFGYGGENRFLTAGKRRVIVEYRGVRFLLQICYDLRFPVWSRNRDDYDAAIYVASWPESRRDVWRTLLRARAIENEAYVIGVNRTGNDGTASYSGDSAIIDYKGATLAETADRDGTKTAVIDIGQMRHFRRTFPALDDADSFTIDI